MFIFAVDCDCSPSLKPEEENSISLGGQIGRAQNISCSESLEILNVFRKMEGQME
jgi:hypothetical protein